MIILLTGKKCSGKDTIAQFICGGESNICELYAFADPLKEITSKILYATYNDPVLKDLSIYYDQDEKEKEREHIFMGKPLTLRAALQYFGTDVMRNMYESLWTTVMVDRLTKSRAEVCIVTDVRFMNEFKCVISSFPDHEIVCCHVERPSLEDSLDMHASEMNINYIAMEMKRVSKTSDNVTFHHIKNDSTLEELRNKTKLLLS